MVILVINSCLANRLQGCSDNQIACSQCSSVRENKETESCLLSTVPVSAESQIAFFFYDQGNKNFFDFMNGVHIESILNHMKEMTSSSIVL